jgi:hypothetical protein
MRTARLDAFGQTCPGMMISFNGNAHVDAPEAQQLNVADVRPARGPDRSVLMFTLGPR